MGLDLGHFHVNIFEFFRWGDDGCSYYSFLVIDLVAFVAVWDVMVVEVSYHFLEKLLYLKVYQDIVVFDFQ